ncbi:hypothetical protein BGZ60DRAFT_566740 [Tricladium varicosporioides]|nr:hypothetical protein BGZ60DRAFT_566740 [Hymenoscyphus varicosporioides]
MSASLVNNAGQFQLLPPELHYHILTHISDLETLLNLLQASPISFAAYKGHRKKILYDVVINALGPVVLPIALQTMGLKSCRKKYERRRPKALKFLENFPQNCSECPQELDADESKALLKFHKSVDYMISGFTTSRFIIVKGLLESCAITPSMPPSAQSKPLLDPLTLSKTEYLRLARGFYYLEMYGRLFHERLAGSDNFTTQEQAHFLQYFDDWELEEFLCIRSYCNDNIWDFLLEQEEIFIKDFLHEMGTSSTGIETPMSIDPLFSKGARRSEQPLWVETRLTCGLLELQRMFSAKTRDERCDAFERHYRTPRRVMIEAINIVHSTPKTNKDSHAAKNALSIIKTPNEGWSWTLRSMAPSILSFNSESSRMNEGMRRWGYVIWDYERLSQLNILDQHPGHMAMKCFRPVCTKKTGEERILIQKRKWDRERMVLAGVDLPSDSSLSDSE